jgi:hypothetical protein
MDLDLAAHLFQCMAALPLREKIGLVFFSFTAIVGFIWFFWWFGYKRGFFFGKVEEVARCQSIRRNNDKLKVYNRDLSEDISKLKFELETHKAGGITGDEQAVLAVRVHVSNNSGDAWSLRQAAPPVHLAERLTYNGTKVIVIGNLKGGGAKQRSRRIWQLTSTGN